MKLRTAKKVVRRVRKIRLKNLRRWIFHGDELDFYDPARDVYKKTAIDRAYRRYWVKWYLKHSNMAFDSAASEERCEA